MNLTNFILGDDKIVEEVTLVNWWKEELPIRSIEFRQDSDISAFDTEIWNNYQITDFAVPGVLNPRYYPRTEPDGQSGFWQLAYDKTNHLEISPDGKKINKYWNSSNTFKEFFIAVWDYIIDKSDIEFKGAKHFRGDMGQTFDYIQASSLSLDLSEVNGILDVAETYLQEIGKPPKYSIDGLLYLINNELPFENIALSIIYRDSSYGPDDLDLIMTRGKYLHFKTTPNTTSNSRTGKIKFNLHLGYIQAETSLEYIPTRVSSKDYYVVTKNKLMGYNVWKDNNLNSLYTIENYLSTPNPQYAYKSISTMWGLAGHVDHLPLTWRLSNYNKTWESLSMSDQFILADFELNKLSITEANSEYITVDGVNYYKDTPNGVLDIYYGAYPINLSFEISLHQYPSSGAVLITQFTTTGDDTYWEVSPVNKIYGHDEFFLISNISYDSLPKNSHIDIFFQNTYATGIEQLNVPYFLQNRDLTSGSLITDQRARIKVTGEEFKDVYYQVDFSNYKSIVIGLIKTTYLYIPSILSSTLVSSIIDQTRNKSITTITFVLDAAKPAQKAWIVFNGGNLSSPIKLDANINEDPYGGTLVSTGVLNSGTLYTYKVGAGNVLGEVETEPQNFMTPPMPYYVSVTQIESSRANCNGSVTGITTGCGFMYKKTDLPDSSENIIKHTAVRSGDVFTSGLMQLIPDTNYTIWAWAENSGGLTESTNRKTFQTLEVYATVTTKPATNISQTTVTLNGEYSKGTYDITNVGFLWGLTTTSTSEEIKSAPNLNEGIYSISLPMVSSNTKYYFQAFVVDNKGHRYYGQWESFTTTQDVVTYGIVVTPSYWSIGYTGGTQSITVTPTKYVNGVASSEVLAWTTTVTNTNGLITNISKTQGQGETSLTVTAGVNTGAERYAAVKFILSTYSSIYSSFEITQAGSTAPVISLSSLIVDSSTQITVTYSINWMGGSIGTYGVYMSLSSSEDYTFYQGSNYNTSTSKFSIVFSSLTPDTWYYFKGYAENSVGLYAITAFDFDKTQGVLPSVVTGASTATFNSLSLEGQVTDSGSSSISSCGFRYGTSFILSSYQVKEASLPSSGGYFNATVTANISPSTKYYYCAFAISSVGTTLGEINSITTPAAIYAPIFNSFSVTSNGQTSLSISTNISSGGSAITSAKIYYKKSSESTYSFINVYGVTEGFFSDTLTGLAVGTNYNVYMWVENSIGTTTSATRTTSTDPVIIPSVGWELDSFNDPIYTVNDNTIKLYGKLLSDGGGSITYRGFSYALSTNANGALISPVTITISTSGNFEKLIEALDYDTKYYCQVFATNSAGTGVSSILAITTEEETAGSYTINLWVNYDSNTGKVVYMASITDGGPATSAFNISVSQFTTYNMSNGAGAATVYNEAKVITINKGSSFGEVSTSVNKTAQMVSGKVSGYGGIINSTINTPVQDFLIEL